MLFEFLKYLQPTHYFGLYTNSGKSVFPKTAELPENVLSQIIADSRYTSDVAKEYDLSWQAIQNGYTEETSTYRVIEKISIQDNYHFIRKNTHSAWVLYVLLLRLLCLKNPITELSGWYSTKPVRRIKTKPIIGFKDGYDNFKSALIAATPKISVIIPTLNRYEYLANVLKDFEQQDYSHFEIIVVDQSDPFDELFYKDFKLNIKLIRQEEKALWLARNTAIKHASGDFIALSEDDVRIASNWLSEHLKCLDYFNARVSAGVFYPDGQSIPIERSFFAIATQFATGNAMLYKDVFKTVGLFDRQFEKQRMGDGEFGLRLFLADIKSVSNPKAYCIDVKAAEGGLREMGSWDAFRPSSFFAPRPIPSVLYYFRRYYGNTKACFALMRTIPFSLLPYQFKKNRLLLFTGLIISILLLPVLCIQVWRSWHLASKKIKQGPLIDSLF